jgi:cyanophycin synthetase
LAEGETDFVLLSLDRVPLTHNGRIGFQVENVLAAAGACWALGMPCEQIRMGLESFSSHMDKVPGRFNLMEIHGATVVVDYGHNQSSLLAIAETLDQFPHPVRTVIYSAAGDRRDVDMIRQGEILADHFDRIILYEDQYLRGRKPGEIMGLFKQGMDGGKRVKEIHEMQGWQNAVDRALKLIRKGEFLLMQADTIDEAVQYLHHSIGQDSMAREIELDTAIQKPTESVAKMIPIAEPLPESKSRSI